MQVDIELRDHQDAESFRLMKWYVIWSCALTLILIIVLACAGQLHAAEFTDEQIVNAIYLAEGGAKTNHPYGILTRYKVTTPRQACFNTVRHARRDWDGKGDFLEFLQRRYAPIGATNDPTNLNRNWLKNVRYFLARRAK